MYRALILLLAFIACSKDSSSNISSVDILAKVGDKIITLDDYYNRAEYTIRPLYCKGNLYIHKKIILNNLIAEKLLSLDSEMNDYKINSKALESFIKGRKEQAMRKMLYFQQGYQKAEVNNEELSHYYKMAGRTYEVSFFSYPSGAFADSVSIALEQGILLSEIYTAAFGGKIPSREVKWEDSNDPIIDRTLFNSEIQKGQIIGPTKLDDDSFFIMQINGWKDVLELSDVKSADRLQRVNNTLKERKGISIYAEYVKDVMKGVEVSFNKEVFDPYVESISKRFFRTKKSKESAISNALFNSDELLDLSQIEPSDEIFDELSLYTIGSKTFTVQDFEEGIASHPLVFRNKKMDRSEFPKQFRLAIIDYIQDSYLTQKAYELDIDKSFEVMSEEQLWLDSFKAFQYSSLIINKMNEETETYIALRETIDKLQQKYNDVIEIDMELFESIELSKVDMFVTQSNVPYPIVVPNFPSYTDDSYLNFGKKMNTLNN